MKGTKRIVSIVLSVVMLFSMVVVIPTTVSGVNSNVENVGTQSVSGNFSKNYSLTGKGTQDMLNIAMAQNEKTQGQLGYREAWCADFVSDCAKLAGQSSAIPFNGVVQSMYNAVINAGGTRVTSPSPGHLVFYGTPGSYGHVGIATDASSSISGNVYYNGQSPSKVKILQNKYMGFGNNYCFVRPKYNNTPTGHTHNYNTFSGYQSAHPHYAIYKCSCGLTQVEKKVTKYSASCSTCLNNLSPAQTISDGEYHIVSALDETFGLNVAYDSKDNKANVQLWNNMEETNKSSVISVKHLGSGLYSLTFNNSGKVLDVVNKGTEKGTNVWQYDSNLSDAQKWIIKETGDGYFYIISKCNGLYLDVTGGVANPATNIQVWIGNGTKAQKWKFVKFNPLTDPSKDVTEKTTTITQPTTPPTSATIWPDDIDFDVDNEVMTIGTKQKVHYVITPANATNKNIEWKSSDTSIATVSNDGVITAKSVGSVEIWATYALDELSWISHCIDITVVKPQKTTVSLARYSANVYVKGSTVIKPTVKNGKGKTTYKSSNTKVAKVYSNGKVVALKAGTAKITVTNNKVSKVFTVKVLNPRLSRTSVSISRGKSYNLKIVGRIGTAKFYTSNKKVATVNSAGKITVNKKAKKNQSCYITVKTNGVTLRCKVKVK